MRSVPGFDPDGFRDHIATADQTGQRIWVYPVKPKGRLYRARSLVALALLALFFIVPFLKLSGQPLILLDIFNRHFIIFGLVFQPHDLHLFVLMILTLVVFILQFTAIFGRLFCGWICPQTIFMEMVFRRIEYWIDGGPSKQRKLREGPWTLIKIFKRLLKQSIYFTLSLVIANFVIAYIIGIHELRQVIAAPPTEHLIGFSAMLIFTSVFYFIFSWFREQACTIVCPYGRLQGALIDSNSIIVAYDHVRGEPRARRSKGQDRSEMGDCVDCLACVSVCPTGIDIRNGTQLECVNCTACIDACNSIMRSVKTPEGLIRYTSEERLAGQTMFHWSGRIITYSVVLALLISLLSILMIYRTDIETTILRAPGTMFYVTEEGTIRNLFSVKIVNKTFDRMPIELRVKDPAGGSISIVKGEILLESEGIAESAILVEFPREQLSETNSQITIEVMSNGQILEEVNTLFLGPNPGGVK